MTKRYLDSNGFDFLSRDTSSKNLQDATPDGTLVAPVECDIKNTHGVCLPLLLGDHWKFVRKNEVGSRVLFSDHTETVAIMRLWERG